MQAFWCTLLLSIGWWTVHNDNSWGWAFVGAAVMIAILALIEDLS